jgi:hypothetical protein
MDTTHEKVAARSHLNSIREAMGLNILRQNDQLNIAAQAHADYLVANNESSHFETEGHHKFVGVRPVDRTLYADYSSTYVSENLSTHIYSGQESINGLFSAIYHRFGFLSLNIDEIGVGAAQDKNKTSNSAFVYVMANSYLEMLCHEKGFFGSGKYFFRVCKNEEHRIREKEFTKAQTKNKKNNPKIVIYPYDGQIEVPPVFYDESPDPLPDHEVSGFPISIEFSDYYFKKVQLLSFRLYSSSGIEVKDTILMQKRNDPHQLFNDKQFALFPLKRLDYSAEYKVAVHYRTKNKEHTITWNFKTLKLVEKLHIIKNKNATIHLAKGKSHILYLPPLDAHDILEKIQFPADVNIVFIDHNTLRLSVMDEGLDDFKIKSKARTIHVIMD